MILILIIVSVCIFLLSSFPLYFSVKFLGGKTTIFKTSLVILISGLIISILKYLYGLTSSFVVFLIMVIIYHHFFKLKWWKSFLVWFIQLFFISLFYVFISLLFGSFLLISLL